ncbi:MAG: glycoside hydrolase family 71/99-like protein [Planctomycetota bacterium]|nr:glycoside hydrolase family 71/99-like protein [Planctomycetota bacterium]
MPLVISRHSPPATDKVLAHAFYPYTGRAKRGVDTSTLNGKVMCGYQGWFSTKTDGSGRGWFHWGRGGEFGPGKCTVELWPDMTECGADERFPTGFNDPDGGAAEVFSSYKRETVLRHFKWMHDYGIDGAFVQRFVGSISNRQISLNFTQTVLNHCREGANNYGRAYAVMYDLSGQKGDVDDRLITDWKRLVDRAHITRDKKDKAYLHHNGRPVVAVWGIGFGDNRKYTLDDCERIVDFLKDDPRYGGNTVMLGVPSWWRELKRDAVSDPGLHKILLKADIISPWAVGRFGPAGVKRHWEEVIVPDIAWCKKNKKDYLPVVFPGFSWSNLKEGAKFDHIPRQGGRFLWSQFAQAKKAGAKMVYQAMFDEVDEATAIFKCTNNPPVSDKNRFLTYEGLPSDHYLKLVGKAAEMISGKIPFIEELPKLNP